MWEGDLGEGGGKTGTFIYTLEFYILKIYYLFLKKSLIERSEEMVQQFRLLVALEEDLNSVPGTHGSQSPEIQCLWPPTILHTHTHTHPHKDT